MDELGEIAVDEFKATAPSTLATAGVTGVTHGEEAVEAGSGAATATGLVVEPATDLAMLPTRTSLILTPDTSELTTAAQRGIVDTIVNVMHGMLSSLRCCNHAIFVSSKPL